jgi:hypothetical protein
MTTTARLFKEVQGQQNYQRSSQTLFSSKAEKIVASLQKDDDFWTEAYKPQTNRLKDRVKSVQMPEDGNFLNKLRPANQDSMNSFGNKVGPKAASKKVETKRFKSHIFDQPPSAEESKPT